MRRVNSIVRGQKAHCELLDPPAEDCTRCGQLLPEREPGLCQQRGQSCQDGTGHRERKIPTAWAKLERLRLKLQNLKDALAAATAAADRAEDVAGAALKDRDHYDQDHPAGSDRRSTG